MSTIDGSSSLLLFLGRIDELYVIICNVIRFVVVIQVTSYMIKCHDQLY